MGNLIEFTVLLNADAARIDPCDDVPSWRRPDRRTARRGIAVPPIRYTMIAHNNDHMDSPATRSFIRSDQQVPAPQRSVDRRFSAAYLSVVHDFDEEVTVRSFTRWSVGVLAGSAAIVSAAVLVTQGETADSELVRSGSLPTADVHAAVPPPTCGTTLPRTVALPDGLIEDGNVAGTDGSLVRRWSSTAASLQVQWPAPPEANAEWSGPTGDAPAAILGDARKVDGGFDRRLTVRLPGQPDGCSLISFDVSARDEGAVNAVMEPLAEQPFESLSPLVVSAEDGGAPADGLTALGCPQSPSTGGGAETGSRAATPDDALRAFLNNRHDLLPDLYVETRESDDVVDYRRYVDGALVTEVTVARDADTWSVVSWRASGC